MHHIGNEDHVMAFGKSVREEISVNDLYPFPSGNIGKVLTCDGGRRGQLEQGALEITILMQHRNQPRSRPPANVQHALVVVEVIGAGQGL